MLVIGGGPAGLQTAWVAAARGHQVSLWEKAEELGGRLRLAAMPPYKEEIHSLVAYLAYQTKKHGVSVRTGAKATTEDITRTKVDVIILATRAKVRLPDFKGLPAAFVFTAEQVLLGQAMVGQKVLVSGGGMVACETAEWLLKRGHAVTLLTSREVPAPDMEPRARKLLIGRLLGAGGDVVTCSRIVELADHDIVFDRAGLEERLMDIDTLVLATGYVPQTELQSELESKGVNVYAIGDCRNPRTAFEAIHEGFAVACQI